MADGGEGTLDAFEAAVPKSVRRHVRVTGPLGDPVEASWLLLPDGTAVVELASTSGITLLAPGRLRPQDATTRGFGEAVADALASGATSAMLKPRVLEKLYGVPLSIVSRNGRHWPVVA